MKTNNVNIQKFVLGISLALAVAAGGCNGYMKSNTAHQLFFGLFFSTSPVLNGLSITATTTNSITLAQPGLLTVGNPNPAIVAYIGVDGAISVSGPAVTGSTEGPIDVYSSGYTFGGLSDNTTYRIVVIAQNSNGYSVEQIVQSTGGLAPVLDTLVISAMTDVSIELDIPQFTAAGNPLPTTIYGYIGYPGIITESGGVVTGYLEADIDVSGGHNFTGLAPNTMYRIYVVAENSVGYSSGYIDQSTGGAAPVMNALVVSDTTDTSVTLDQPGFLVSGNPTPEVTAYIGEDGTISESGGTVNDYIDNEVITAGTTFSGLTEDTNYRIIVVAENSGGYHVRQIVVSTGSIAPVMKPLVISATTINSVTIAQPTYDVMANPDPVVTAYIALPGAMTESGGTVTGWLDSEVITTGTTFGSLTIDTAYEIIVVAANSGGYHVRRVTASTGVITPVMNPLVVSAAGVDTLTLDAPSYATSGNPTPTVTAYIGENNVISISGKDVTGEDDSGDALTGITFSGLADNTDYRIIVVAENSGGYNVRQVVVSTGGTAPVMDPLVVSATGVDSVTLDAPTYATPGNPTPTVTAYIGEDGVISVSGKDVTGEGDSGNALTGITFDSLTDNTVYRIIVVAENSGGYNVRQVVVSTGGIAPALDALVITNVTYDSVTLDAPGYLTLGNPTPTVMAYIGEDGVISVSGKDVTDEDGSGDAYTGITFNGLSDGVTYRIIVVAENSGGYSVRQVVVTTGGIAPVMKPIVVSVDPGPPVAVVLDPPDFTTFGVPTPSILGYIGEEGTIFVNGDTVSGSVIEGDIDVTLGHTFSTGITSGTTYCVIVVAKNSGGYHVRQALVSP